jgi:hypothetical protein
MRRTFQLTELIASSYPMIDLYLLLVVDSLISASPTRLLVTCSRFCSTLLGSSFAACLRNRWVANWPDWTLRGSSPALLLTQRVSDQLRSNLALKTCSMSHGDGEMEPGRASSSQRWHATASRRENLANGRKGCQPPCAHVITIPATLRNPNA